MLLTEDYFRSCALYNGTIGVAISGLCPQGGLWKACMCACLCLFFKRELIIITSALTNIELYSWSTSTGWSKTKAHIFLLKNALYSGKTQVSCTLLNKTLVKPASHVQNQKLGALQFCFWPCCRISLDLALLLHIFFLKIWIRYKTYVTQRNLPTCSKST